jgi:DNA-binding response OmpR family regulator
MKDEKKVRILLVEDEKSLLKVLADKFKREGFTIYEASDGEEGLNSAIKHRPNLIVLDLVMPNMDGMTMLKRLRENKQGLSIPVLILTNLSDPEYINQANGWGVIEYMVKSNWSLDDVIVKARETLKKHGK